MSGVVRLVKTVDGGAEKGSLKISLGDTVCIDAAGNGALTDVKADAEKS